MKLITKFITVLAITSCVAESPPVPNCSSLSKKPCKKSPNECEYLRLSNSCKAKSDLTCGDFTKMGKKCLANGCKVVKKECVPAVSDCASITNVSKCKKDDQCTFVKKSKGTPRHCIQKTPATTPAPTNPAPTKLPNGSGCSKDADCESDNCKSYLDVIFVCEPAIAKATTPAPTTPAPTTPAPTTPAPTTPAPTAAAPTKMRVGTMGCSKDADCETDNCKNYFNTLFICEPAIAKGT